MSQALEGVRVLDLTNVLAGPFCAYQLALLGAEVIKVEVPDGGDLARQLGADAELNAKLMGASFLSQNSGKKSMTLNLKTPGGKEVLKRLVATADVLVENYRPGVMQRLGLSWDVLKEANPRLVYCAISGFGQSGPLKDTPAYDQIIQGLSGMMSITGEREGRPLRVGYPVADTLSGITAAFAISSALVRRARTNEGAFIDVSMLDSSLITMGWVVSNHLIAGVPPQRNGNDNFTAAPSGAFQTRDGLLNIAANKQEQFETLARLIGRDDLISDERFSKREARKSHRAALTVEVEAALSARPAAEWAALMSKAGIPAGRVVTVPEALDSPQVRERGLLQTFRDAPGVGRDITVPRTGFKMSGGDPVATSPPPLLGADTASILGALGYGATEQADLRAAGAL